MLIAMIMITATWHCFKSQIENSLLTILKLVKIDEFNLNLKIC